LLIILLAGAAYQDTVAVGDILTENRSAFSYFSLC
jgi:hypothetical protein